MWFKKLTGFDEESPEQVRDNLRLEDNRIVSRINGRSFQYGHLEVPSLSELKSEVGNQMPFEGQMKVSEIVADVQALHRSTENQQALFQAASQFNLLEMVGPHITPEQGVDRYAFDPTQGPACTIACGAGTIYRNYFVSVMGGIGQTVSRQIDCLELIGKGFQNDQKRLWSMENGYALLKEQGLLAINAILSKLDSVERERLKGKLKIGIQWDTQVTISQEKQIVSQAYCSALPVAYLSIDTFYWEYFARLILEATYEATLYAALINLKKTGCNRVFLTLVGGGAFGNELSWILESIHLALQKFRSTPLNVYIVSYGSPNPGVKNIIEGL